MTSIRLTSFLHTVLVLDAITCCAAAALQLAAAHPLADLLGVPVPLLVGSGLFLLGYVVLLVAMTRVRLVWSWLLPLVVVGNVAWGVACLALATGGGLPVTPLGQAYLSAQALAVFVFAVLEWRGWRASPRADGVAAAA